MEAFHIIMIYICVVHWSKSGFFCQCFIYCFKPVIWGKVDVTKEQMVFAEATSVLPLIASDAYHRESWKNRDKRNFSKIFN